ncbi:MAG: DUF1801 domain-containing protein [Propionibacteriaceae bacterium]|jgi:uncharacterized protein YdhG (YjbR/CyaY superfamily)|nr:DUF1801 domain-containing protein [Propionibacteriaceae bacterium]
MWTCPACGREFAHTDQHHFCHEIPEIDDYIAAQPEARRPLLQQVRACIHAAAPEASERISWRMPTFWQEENLIHFASFKNHLGIFPGDMTDIPFPERVETYRTSKGTLQFPYDKPVDFDLIADITAWRVERALARHPQNTPQM